MNKITLIGNLTRDPELSQTPNGIPVCKFTLAVTRRFANAEGGRETDFFNCIAWRAVAENCNKFLQKGKKAAVSGSVQIRRYEDREGITRTAVEVTAEEVEFLSSNTETKLPRKAKSIADLEEVEDDGELPF